MGFLQVRIGAGSSRGGPIRWLMPVKLMAGCYGTGPIHPRNDGLTLPPALASSPMLKSLTLAAAVLSVFSPLAARAAEDARIFELRIYTCAPGKLPDLLKRFREHTCKLFEKHGMENLGYWVPVDPENGSETTLYYILAHKSREAAKESFAAFGKDPEWQAARDAGEVGGKILARPPESIFMKATDYSPAIRTGAEGGERAFELRIYQTPEGKLDALHTRFRDHTMKLFTKHGMTHIGYWQPVDADKGAATKLIYILAHASKEAGLASFTAFRADPDWVKAKAESEKDGSLTVDPPNGVRSIYMKATDFSPIK